MKTTKQIIFTQPGEWEIREVELPELKEDEVIVKVEACGLCTWERHIFDGKENVQFPFAGGHEIAATIVEKGTKVSSSLQIGDKVAVAKWDRCNECYDCRRGLDNHCGSNFSPIESGQVWGPGGFSEYLVAKSYEVYKLFGDNDVHYAALTEPVACVTRAISKAKLDANDTTVVIGAGVMGLIFLKLLKLRGQKVIVIELSEYRRNLAEKMGANLVIDPTKKDWVEEVHNFTNQRGAKSIFYTAGGIEVLNQCLQAVTIGGYVVIYAPLHIDAGLLNVDEIHYRELVLTGSIRHDKESFRQAAELIGDGSIDLTDLNLEFRPFEKIDQAMHEANENSQIHRILLTWS